MDNNDWILEHLSIMQNWTKNGFYTGNVKFKNGVKMELSIRLDSDKAAKMIAILQEEIVASAVELSSKLMKSMPVQLPASSEHIPSETTRPEHNI
jgi:hypothetical protein